MYTKCAEMHSSLSCRYLLNFVVQSTSFFLYLLLLSLHDSKQSFDLLDFLLSCSFTFHKFLKKQISQLCKDETKVFFLSVRETSYIIRTWRKMDPVLPQCEASIFGKAIWSSLNSARSMHWSSMDQSSSSASAFSHCHPKTKLTQQPSCLLSSCMSLQLPFSIKKKFEDCDERKEEKLRTRGAKNLSCRKSGPWGTLPHPQGSFPSLSAFTCV